jgi:ankyrin repeat protein
MFKLLDKGENVNTREMEDFKTLAHILCKRGDLETFRKLIKYEPDLEALDYEFMTPLFEAVISDNIQLLEYMIEELKVNLNHTEIQNRTAFYWAACNGDVRVVEYLLTKNVDVNINSSMGRTPLSKSVWNGRVDIVERLLKVPGIDIDQQDTNSRAPIHNAVWGANGGRLGKKVSGVGTGDSPECVLALIAAGAKLEVEDKEGYTPLMIAASTGGVSSLRLLIEQGCNPYHLNIEKADCLIEATRFNNTECIKAILELVKDIDLNIKDVHDMSAIDYAVAFDHPQNLELFIQYKKLNDTDLLNILNICIFSNSLQCFKLIVDLINKQAFFIRNSYHIFVDVIERILNLSLYDLFNMLVDEYKNYIETVFFQDIQNICKLVILSEKYIDEKKGNKEDSKEEKDDKDDKDEEEELVVKESTKESSNKFLENSKGLIDMYLQRLKENKHVSETFLKTLIFQEKFDIIKAIFEHVHPDEAIYVNDEIKINMDNYTKFKISRKRKKTRNVFVHWGWKEVIDTINHNNVLSISLTIPVDTYIDWFVGIKHFQKYLFTKLSDNRNLLHMLFVSGNTHRFLKVIKLVEGHYPNQIDLIIHMLDEHDNHSLTPLDLLMKHKLFEMVQTYTEYINQLRVKHNIPIQHKKDIVYKVQDFFIREENEIITPVEYKEYFESAIKLSKETTMNFISDFEIYKRFWNDNKFLENTNHIVKLIDSKVIDKQFKIANHEYHYQWVANEKMLRECAEYLKGFSYLGIDMEVHGEDVIIILILEK